MSCTCLPKTAKPVWAYQLTRLPYLVVNVKFQFVYTTTSEIGCQVLPSSTSSNVLLGRGSEKAFNECLGVRNVFPSAAYVQIWLLLLHLVKRSGLSISTAIWNVCYRLMKSC